MPREEVVRWRLQEEKEGYVPSQSDRRENTGGLEDIRFISDHIMYDTFSEGKRNHNKRRGILSIDRYNVDFRGKIIKFLMLQLGFRLR